MPARANRMLAFPISLTRVHERCGMLAKREREHVATPCRHAAGLPVSKTEQKSLAAAVVSQRLLIRRAKELIAQPEPATQLLRRLCHSTEPMLTCEVCMEFGKGRILPKRQQCDARTFRQR